MDAMAKKLESCFGTSNLMENKEKNNDESENSGSGINSGPIVEFLNETPADIFILAGPINNYAAQRVANEMAVIKNSESAILWLTTFGGSPDAAYMIARSLQRKYENLSVFIDGDCKSSGTLICLGADSLIMGCEGHIGPLDIQIMSKEEFGERHSGLNLLTALENVTSQASDFLRSQFLDVRFGGGLGTKQALEVATNLTGQLFSPITCQLDFMKYGEFTRSMRIGLEYGERLAAHRSGNLHPGAVQALVTGYPSHGFVIDREEAAEKLFLNVEKAGEDITAFANELHFFVAKSLIENDVLFINAKSVFNIEKITKQNHGDGEEDVSKQSDDEGKSSSRPTRRKQAAQDKGERDES